eukprot:TRINITY_DN11068_c0_g1_i1.p1 TRINITY_DN11068_c0_g1~~TRINITY_DN11068_c0_g1_i1.p1  ORF type:complete len:115 (-),score=29.64 TRINITY_DN11068_c0_g1_i1:65-364(-)
MAGVFRPVFATFVTGVSLLATYEYVGLKKDYYIFKGIPALEDEIKKVREEKQDFLLGKIKALEQQGKPVSEGSSFDLENPDFDLGEWIENDLEGLLESM